MARAKTVMAERKLAVVPWAVKGGEADLSASSASGQAGLWVSAF